MFILTDILQQVEQHLRFCFFQLSCGKYITTRIVRSVETVILQSSEIRLLIQLFIRTRLVHYTYIFTICTFIHLCMLHHIFEQTESLRHILGKSVETDGNTTFTHFYIEIACQFVELLLHLFGSQRVGTKIIDIFRCILIACISFLSEPIAESKSEASVLLVLHINVWQFSSVFLRLHTTESEVSFEIHKLWLNRFHLRLLYLLHKLTHILAVRRNRCDGRFVNLLLIRVCTLTLIHSHIIICEMSLCKIHNLLLRHLLHTTYISYLLLPVDTTDERIELHVRTCRILLK